MSTYNSGLIDESATEIVTYDLKTQRLFVFNASGGDGGRPYNSHDQFIGRIGDVYVASCAFSEKEIQGLMNSVLPVIWSQLKNN